MAFGICETFQNVISEYGDCCSQNTTEDGRAPKDRRIVQLGCFRLRQSCIIIHKHDFLGNSTSQIRLPTASIGQECESIRNPIQLDATDQADHRRGMHHQLFSPGPRLLTRRPQKTLMGLNPPRQMQMPSLGGLWRYYPQRGRDWCPKRDTRTRSSSRRLEMRHAGDACPRHAADEQGLSLACRNTQLRLDTKCPVLEPNRLQMYNIRLPRSCHRLLLSTIVPRKKQSRGPSSGHRQSQCRSRTPPTRYRPSMGSIVSAAAAAPIHQGRTLPLFHTLDQP